MSLGLKNLDSKKKTQEKADLRLIQYIMNNMMFQFDLKGDGIYIVYCINHKINIDVIPVIDNKITLLDLKTMFNKLLKEGESFIMPITCTNYLN